MKKIIITGLLMAGFQFQVASAASAAADDDGEGYFLSVPQGYYDPQGVLAQVEAVMGAKDDTKLSFRDRLVARVEGLRAGLQAIPRFEEEKYAFLFPLQPVGQGRQVNDFYVSLVAAETVIKLLKHAARGLEQGLGKSDLRLEDIETVFRDTCEEMKESFGIPPMICDMGRKNDLRRGTIGQILALSDAYASLIKMHSPEMNRLLATLSSQDLSADGLQRLMEQKYDTPTFNFPNSRRELLDAGMSDKDADTVMANIEKITKLDKARPTDLLFKDMMAQLEMAAEEAALVDGEQELLVEIASLTAANLEEGYLLDLLTKLADLNPDYYAEKTLDKIQQRLGEGVLADEVKEAIDKLTRVPE